MADIETILLQASNTYKEQIREYVYTISKKLWNITYGDMEKQAHYIQLLSADELDWCKGKGNERVETYIKIIQEAYQESYYNSS